MLHKPKGYVQSGITLRNYLIIVHICLSNNISRMSNNIAQWIAQGNAHREKMHRAIRGVRGVVFFRGNTPRNYLREITTV